MIRLLVIAVLFIVVSHTRAQESVDDSRQWAVSGLGIIDVATGEITPNQTILIRNGVIQAVGDSSVVTPDSNVLTIDHTGHYAIPGFWDMHVHMRGGQNLINANERWLRQYLGFGVTAVRDAGGDLPNSVLHWKAEIAQGDIFGPRIFSALRKLDGNGYRQPGSIPIDSAEAIDAALANLIFAGADFVKLYDLSFPPELFPLAVSKAESRGLKSAAHAPLYVPFADVIDAGLDSVEHIFFFVKAANPDDRLRSVQQTIIEPFDTIAYLDLYAGFGGRVDESHARDMFRRMARQGTAIVPTLAIERGMESILKGGAVDPLRAAQTPLAILETLESSAAALANAANEWLPSAEIFWRHARRFLRIAADEGVMILAGSDTGAGNAGVYPGDSLHAELKTLVEYGLSPVEALQSATLEPARWMGLQDRFGSVSPGAAADIVILESNPLGDIANTRSVAAVIQQGVYFDETELEALRNLVGH